MQAMVNGFGTDEPTRPHLVRRKSWVILQRRRSQRLQTLKNVYDEEETPNSLTEPYNFIHLFTLLLCITRRMTCKICDNLFIDVTILNCGHAFCKSCLIIWFQTKEHCPVCLKFEVYPTCNRCYQLDSLIESVYPPIFDILDHPILSSSCGDVHHSSNITPQTFQKMKRMENLRKMHQIRKDRREALVICGCVNKTSPNRSMLQGVSDLGFGLRNSMEGFILLIIGSFFLCLSLCQISDILEKLELIAVRRICYVILIMYMICSQRIPFIRSEVGDGRRMFWEQILKTTVTEEYDPLFPCEKARMKMLLKTREINAALVQREATEIIEKLGALVQHNSGRLLIKKCVHGPLQIPDHV